jgi:hypothetical protein
MHENKMGSAPFSVAAPGSASSVFPAKSEWLTATEAAQYLKVKPRSLLLWVREGESRHTPFPAQSDACGGFGKTTSTTLCCRGQW